jgi:hypothetical protein
LGGARICAELARGLLNRSEQSNSGSYTKDFIKQLNVLFLSREVPFRQFACTLPGVSSKEVLGLPELNQD